MRAATRLALVVALALGFGRTADAQMFGGPWYHTECKSMWFSTHDGCRDARDGPFPRTWSVFVEQQDPILSADCDGKTVEIDIIEHARRSCNRRNTTRKEDLKECFEKGIGIKTNFDVDKACPKGDLVHTLPEDADLICDDGPTEKKDPGNGWFATCEAEGPGPSGTPNKNWKPWNHDGCCLVGKVQKPGRGWEMSGKQQMVWDKWNDEKWAEPFFGETESHELYMCNPPDTQADESYTHYYCAETSQDIMVEGWQNPVENTGHQGPGWCNVTTGSYDPGRTTVLDQIFGDLAKAVQYIGEPKGIVPKSDDRYDENDPHPRYMCDIRRDNFDTHCSDGELRDTHQFAHSMGSIAAAVWGLPFEVFGGAANGGPKAHTVRNNCDPVPEIVDYMNPYAIYFYAKLHMNTPMGGVGNYRWCNDLNVVKNCVKRNGTYIGQPRGPAGCGVNGPPCEYAAWCSWNPYSGWGQAHSGRTRYAPSDCPKAAAAVITEVKQCLKNDGLSKIINCLRAAYSTADLARKFPRAIEDHAFDDTKDWGGYRIHSGMNWDAPRWGRSGAKKHAPPPPVGGECGQESTTSSPMTAVCWE